ncbi:hypothetical protein TPHA_0B04440 [Tetrapisispora phaffii CBS 4417]|uniref:Uncharacterized protein n=1 Tax=Tetrapisispora phaffii (strain ATCC 24235 / CBS 4417 / NBRC 1672 / NRRL Y-8282 / UCD 70-5) TaxID=1071381 RepID=G8BQ32_TETPH|nr:hypothetical protein TPHA_0B04440 [Tetrapisispora phaffii CBS 4417]CCE62113.1 hypothetical protein TPHA_0B04440 [Tetrapisispora phaffii CBS 4417]
MSPPNIPYHIRLKTCLKMVIQRLRYAQEKQQALAKKGRRDVAQLLSNSKEQKAHYRVETLINDDIHIELLELLELYSELLHARVMIVNSVQDEASLIENHMEDGINEAVRALVYATLYVPEVKELTQLRDLLGMKFGNEFLKLILEDHIGVPDKVVRKCSPKLPCVDLVELYLKEIATTYGVPYSLLDNERLENEQFNEKSAMDNEESNDGEGDGNEKPIVAGDNDDDTLIPDEKHPITIRRPRKSSETFKRDFKIPKEIENDVKIKHTVEPIKKTSNDELEDLKKRFAALRR